MSAGQSSAARATSRIEVRNGSSEESVLSDNDVRVLVVDDLEDAAKSLAVVLSLNGYVARTAHDGASALHITKEFRPHCILLDVNMPGIDGLELTQRLRTTYGDDIVLVAVTGGRVEEARVSKTFELVDHYLAKPIEMDKLEKILPARRA
jgi:DNA-binding response OmpR family regulator